MRKNDTACVFDLIAEELAEVFHIHFALGRVHNRAEGVEDGVFEFCVRHRFDDVGELTYPRRFDDDTVGRVLRRDLLQSFGEIADERATDTARIHFGDIDTRVLQKSAVDTDLAEFVLDQNDLFSRVRLFDEFFDKGGLSRAQKSRKNIDFRHLFYLFILYY